MSEDTERDNEQLGEIGEHEQIYRDLLSMHGITPMVGTAECAMHKSKHSKCFSCKHELACLKLVSMMLITNQQSQYRPTSFDDQLRTSNRVAELIDSIVKAETLEEVLAKARGES